MNGKFAGKKLLVLGSNVGSKDIVNYAKANGAYTIVADYLPKEKSEAKNYCDEDVLISTGDTEALIEYISENHIDGVLAGIHEFNLIQAMKLCEHFSFPFYCNKEQWDLMQLKQNFRRLCEKYKVPSPKTYYVGGKLSDNDWNGIEFPAVIKPVDSSASQGVHLCHDLQDMKNCENDAIESSDSKTIMIEEMVKGEEFTAHYTINNGNVMLSCIDNRYPVALHDGSVTTIPIARIYPSKFIDEYIQQVDASMRTLIGSLGLNNAVLFIQGMYDKELNKFYIFESSMRCAGEAPYRIIEKINGINFMQMLVDTALSVQSDYDQNKEDPFFKGKVAGTVSFAAKGGIVGTIEGLDKTVAKVPSVVEYECRYPVGRETPDGDTLRQLMIRFVMICESKERMKHDIRFLNDNITVLNDKNENMVIKFDPERL